MSSNSEPSEGIGELQMDLTSDVKHDEKLEVQELPSSDHPATPEELDGDEALKLVGAQRKDSDVFSDEYNAVLKRKLDWLIPPIAGAVYFTQFLDKNALSYASVMQLPITGPNYNLLSAAFYIGFLIWEFPTQYIAQRLRISKYLGVNIILWGIMLGLQASTTNLWALFVFRLLMGMFESCVAPILIILIGMFYRTEEQAQRISWFYFMNGIAHIVGSCLAYGFSYIPTYFDSYRILFLFLGAQAALVGVMVILWLPDSPVNAGTLTKEERIAALERVRDCQGGTENHHLKKSQVIEALTDSRTWLIVLNTLMTSIPNGGITTYSNLIIKGFGYSDKQALILGAPAGAVMSITVLLCGYYSDKKRERMLPIIFTLLPTVVGAAILVGMAHSGNKGVLLFASYLIGTFGASLAMIYAYNASNIAGHTKKVTVNALTLFTFSVGNIVGTQVFLSKDAPEYIPGKIVIMVMFTAQIFLSLLLRRVNIRMNIQKVAGLKVLAEQNGWDEQRILREREKHAFLDLTDKQNPFFLYTP